MAIDAPDFTDKYNTPLSAEDQQAFVGWAKSQRRGPGRDATADLYDYDLQGWWKENGSQTLTDAHLNDTYKKPNHPTFSDESIYHGVDGHQGGHWEGDDKSGYTFTPGNTNMQMLGIEGLQQYFNQYEPRSKLEMPLVTGDPNDPPAAFHRPPRQQMPLLRNVYPDVPDNQEETEMRKERARNFFKGPRQWFGP